MEPTFHSNCNVVYACTYHVVWRPKYRRKALQGGIDDRLKAIIREVAAERQAEGIEVEVMPDHGHLLVGCDPQFGIHRLMRVIQGRSSRLFRQAFPSLRTRAPTLWTNSSFVATCGGGATGDHQTVH